MVEQQLAEESGHGRDEHDDSEEGDEVDVVAFVTSLQRAGCNGEMVLAALQKVQGRTRFPRPSGAKQAARPRARTPPRDPKDNKCANCN